MINFQKTLTILLLPLLVSAVFKRNESTPCGYYQSVNISGATINENGSAIFEGQEYLNGSFGYFNDSFFGSVLKKGKNKIEPTHLRGCFCHLKGKPCVSMCCPPGYIRKVDYYGTCYPYKYDPVMKSNNYKKINTFKIEDKYRMVQSDPCFTHSYKIHEKWEILEVNSN